MQRNITLSLAAGAALVVTAIPCATAQTLTPDDKKKIEQMIEDLDEALNGGTARNNARALATLQAAAKSPKAAYEFFMEATKELDFDEEGKREADWREWRERNEDRLKSTEHMAALQYQIRFLVMTLHVAIESKETEGVKKALPELIDYLDELAGNFEKLGDHTRVLHGSVLSSVYARKLKLDVTARRLSSWVDAPLPVSRIYDQTVLPHFRLDKNHAALEAAWDKRIIHEAKTLDAGPPEGEGPRGGPGRRWMRDDRGREREEKREETRQQKVSEEEFRTSRLPELQWGKEVDAILFGPERGSAFLALGRILRENLAHPEAQNWLTELKFLAKGNIDSGSYYQGSPVPAPAE